VGKATAQMKQVRTYEITLENLAAYQSAATRNATALLEEARLLLNAGHFARAYFLAEAAIEETGKAAIVHAAKARNISSPSVQAQLRIQFGSHASKIRAAFFAHLIDIFKSMPQLFRERLEEVIKYCSALERGRESAMYADFRNDGSTYEPADVVKPEVARDCVSLALRCSRETAELISRPPFSRFSSADDKWFALGSKGLKVWQESDFGEYLLDNLTKRGASFSMSEAVTTYHDAYLSKGRKFKPVTADDEQTGGGNL
jgi:AbiV family abortive infection protein